MHVRVGIGLERELLGSESGAVLVKGEELKFAFTSNRLAVGSPSGSVYVPEELRLADNAVLDLVLGHVEGQVQAVRRNFLQADEGDIAKLEGVQCRFEDAVEEAREAALRGL